MGQTTKTLEISGPRAQIYQAITDPAALIKWQFCDMTAKIHYFDLGVGGGYQMSLFYPDNETDIKGKTTNKEDRFSARFIELIPNRENR
jgi:uncharacterized protein YndB with AHSA1/START domain